MRADAPRPARASGLPALWVIAWGGVLLYALLHAMLAARLRIPVLAPFAAWRENLPLLVLWAVASPLILGSAARWPITRARWAPPLAAHWGLATAFIIASNLLVRVPTHWSDVARGDVGPLVAATAVGVAAWYHLALIVYGLIVALGHLRGLGNSAPGGSALDGPAPGPAAPPVEVGEDRAPDVPSAESLVVKHRDRILVLNPEELEWVEADGDYVRLHCSSGTLRVRETLAALQARLPAHRFVRVHRSAIVQVARVREVQPFYHGDCYLILRSGARLRLSRTYRERVAAALGREI